MAGRSRRAVARGLLLLGGLFASAAGPVAAETALEGGRYLYTLRCRGCHGADGAGLPGGVPDLRGALSPFTRTPAGRAYLVRVPGVAQSPLDDASLAELLNWLVAGMGGGVESAFVPYDAAEVGVLRARPLIDVAAERRAALSGSRPGAPPPP